MTLSSFDCKVYDRQVLYRSGRMNKRKRCTLHHKQMQIPNLGVIGHRRNFTSLPGTTAIKAKPKTEIKNTHPLLSFHLTAD